MLVALLGVGLLYRSVYTREPLRGSDVSLAIWTGYILVIALLQAWHFVRPIDAWPLLLVCVIGGAGLVRERGQLQPWLAGLRASGVTGTTLVAAGLLLWMANTAVGPIANFDGGLYHLPTIEWVNTYRIVPGLGNLHGRLAFNSSSLLFAAMLDNGPFDGRSFHITAGVLLAPILLHSLGAIRRLSTRTETGVAGDAYAAFLMVPMLIALIIHEASSLDTDAPVALLLLACGERLIRAYSGERTTEATSRWYLASLLLLSAAAVVLKLSAAITAASLFLLVCWTYRGLIAHSARQLLLPLTVVAGLALTWIGRGIILSGYPLYPSSLLPMPVSWRLPAEQTASEAGWIAFSARVVNQKEIPIGEHWVFAWFRGLVNLPQDVTMLTLPLLVTLAGAIAIFRSRRDRTGASRQLPHVWLLYVPPVVGLLFWFATAPHPRFAQGPLWMMACTSLGIAVASQNGNSESRALRVRRAVRSFAAVVAVLGLVQAIWAPLTLASIGWVARASILGGLAIRPGRDHGFHPVGGGKFGVFTTNSGLRVNAPIDNDLCWRSAIICSPHASWYLRMRRAGHPESGFYADSGRWEPVRFPDFLTPFLPYWRCQQAAARAGLDRDVECARQAIGLQTDTVLQVIQAQGLDSTTTPTPSRPGLDGPSR